MSTTPAPLVDGFSPRFVNAVGTTSTFQLSHYNPDTGSSEPAPGFEAIVLFSGNDTVGVIDIDVAYKLLPLLARYVAGESVTR